MSTICFPWWMTQEEFDSHQKAAASNVAPIDKAAVAIQKKMQADFDALHPIDPITGQPMSDIDLLNTTGDPRVANLITKNMVERPEPDHSQFSDADLLAATIPKGMNMSNMDTFITSLPSDLREAIYEPVEPVQPVEPQPSA